MIYIKNDSKSIKIPRHEFDSISPFCLQIVNNLTKTAELYTDLIDKSNDPMFFEFTDINFSDYPDGEYGYCVLKDDDLLEIGLLTCGNYVNQTQQYTEKSNKVQYNG